MGAVAAPVAGVKKSDPMRYAVTAALFSAYGAA